MAVAAKADVLKTGSSAPIAEERPPRATALAWGALADIVGFHLARAAVATDEAFETHVGQPCALRKVEFSLLMLLLANAQLPPKRLAQALAVTAPNLTLLLDRLQERRLLRRERHPQDGRSQNVVLTTRGHKLAQKASAAARAVQAQEHQRLSHAEHAMLIELLDKLSTRRAAR
jgi:DNA-binding MarR family transcriptional regulator